MDYFHLTLAVELVGLMIAGLLLWLIYERT